jgi:hypothetical protein
MHDMGEKLMNRSRSTGVLLVGWGRGSGGLPFPDPLYYYQVDFHNETTMVGERLMNSSRSTGVLLVGWGRGSGGLPFPDLLHDYQVDFLSSDHYSWAETNEQKEEYRGAAGGLGTG